ncbi:MAG TPA: SDR family oxidoreductase [Acidimicrobiales bacterium]|nr:SDR family oxidoreductase [Acidimicrobiales bacterium]
MDLGLAGRVAVVAASSKGLGRASAEALAAEGAAVVISARGKDVLAEAAAAIEATGAAVHAVRCDVTDPDAATLLVDAALSRFGRLDVVVANAGGPPPMRALDVDDASVLAAVQANLLASVRLARAALPHLRAARWGRICCIASASVIQPIPELALSNLARTGLWAWARTAAADLRGSGVTLNLACPGTHATDRMRELGRDGHGTGDPAAFGKVVAFLCSEPAAHVNGAALAVDGGAMSPH